MNLLRHFVTAALVAFSLAGAGSMNTACAELITYTLTGGTLDGTLNGVPFSGLSFTATAEADPTNFATTPFGGTLVYSQTATTTMTLDGFSPFTITTPLFGPFVIDYFAVFPGQWAGGFAVFDGTGFDGLGAIGTLTGDVVYGTGGIVGSFAVEGPLSFSTTAGDLVITGLNDAGATFSSAVPEIDPSCLGSVLALLGGGLGLLERRRWRP